MSFIGNLFKAVLAIVMVLVVVVAGIFIFRFTQGLMGPTKSATAGKTVLFVVRPGDSVSTIVNNLKDAGVIDNDLLFRAKLKLRNAESSLKAGHYSLTTGMDWDQLIDLLTSGVSVGVRFQVIEGSRLEEIADTLGAQGLVSPTKFLQLAGTPEGAAGFQDDFFKASGKPGDRGLEGYLFPDTYQIDPGDGDASAQVIRTMLQGMESKFTPDMLQAMKANGHTVHQTLTIASIVQREGKVPSELPTIASVFWNRIDKGMPLQADPTTQYAVGKEGDWWPDLVKEHISPDTVNHPFNTYVIQGMPPGPICNPGLPAIRAAIYPDDTAYLYFVAKNDAQGSHAFAETLEEQNQNIELYQK